MLSLFLFDSFWVFFDLCIFLFSWTVLSFSALIGTKFYKWSCCDMNYPSDVDGHTCILLAKAYMALYRELGLITWDGQRPKAVCVEHVCIAPMAKNSILPVCANGSWRFLLDHARISGWWLIDVPMVFEQCSNPLALCWLTIIVFFYYPNLPRIYGIITIHSRRLSAQQKMRQMSTLWTFGPLPRWRQR